jgi:hypothetical protein
MKILKQPHPEVVERLRLALLELQGLIRKERKISISQFMVKRRFPPDFVTLLNKTGALICTDGGKRGPRTYKWNKAKYPSEAMAISILKKYSKLRREQAAARGEVNGNKRTDLQQIKADVKEILQILRK